MPLNEVDKAWIREEIRSSRGLLTSVKVIGVGAILTVVGTILFQWSAYVEFRTLTNDRLTVIEKSLTTMGLQNSAALPQQSFDKVLPHLKETFSTLRKDNIKVSPQIVTDLQSKFTDASDSASDYWPTAAAFISYRSFVTSAAPPTSLPNCRDTKPNISTFTTQPTSAGETLKAQAKLAVYKDCRITLDSPEDGNKLNELLRDVAMITFSRCLVIYRGGEVKFALSWNNHIAGSAVGKNGGAVTLTVSGNTVEFIDCWLDFSINESPRSREGRLLTRLFLNQPGSQIDLPLAPTS